MFKRIIKRALALFACLLSVVLAVANRHSVSVSLDPFSTTEPALEFLVPLYLVVLLCLILGILIGGMTSWLGGGRHRKAARAYRREQKKSVKDTAKEDQDSTRLPSEV